MRDLPRAENLLALARDVLLNELLPALPSENRLDARLVAHAMAIAEREAAAGASGASALDGRLAEFYDTAECAPGGAEALWRRFALDLRRGAFAEYEPRERTARALLWRLTIMNLRAANPRFLAANGFA